ncbi:MAG: YczE/YyaS/YitT family protein [Culicoidibacterales bacterium]
MKQFKKYGIEFFMSLIGVITLALGLALIVKAAIGLDPWGILFSGTLSAYNRVTPEAWHIFKYGDMITIVSTLFVFIASFMKKEPIKWLSILSGFVLGQFVNIWLIFLLPIPMTSGTFSWLSYLVLALGIVVLSLGSVIALTFSILMSPVDYLVLAIKEKFPKQEYGTVRICADTSAVILGSIITFVFTQNISNIPVGIGTIIMFFGIGYVINLLLPIVTPVLKKIKK